MKECDWIDHNFFILKVLKDKENSILPTLNFDFTNQNLCLEILNWRGKITPALQKKKQPKPNKQIKNPNQTNKTPPPQQQQQKITTKNSTTFPVFQSLC